MRRFLLVTMAMMMSIAAISQTTVVDIIVGSPDHNTLEAAVIAAGLAETLAGDGPFTVFAPTDDAFNALPDGALDALLADPTGALAQVLLYHVVGASVGSGDLTSGQFATTLNGDSIVVTIDGSSVYINNAMVTAADIMTDNGIVHVIDAVITPGSTVYEVVAGSENHNTLEAAVVAAGLQGALSGPGPFTVFAPTDDAFAALPEGLVTGLLADPKGELTQILLYHVVAGKAMSTDLSDGQMVTTLNGDSITITISEGNVYIDNAMVTAADIETDNGVVHVIDAVIVPRTTVVDIIVGSPDHNTLEAAVIAAGLAETLAGDGPFTVFAPTDAAFNALPEGVVAGLLNDPAGALTDVLLYHVVSGKVMSTDLSDGITATTLQGTDITITINGGDVFINGARVIAADIETDNGVVHVIDAVITPSTGIQEMIIDKANVSIYPNPAREFVNIRYELTEESEVSLEMYDMLGKQVRILEQGYTFKGSHTVEFPVSDLETGMYLLIINTGNSQIANKVRVR